MTGEEQRQARARYAKSVKGKEAIKRRNKKRVAAYKEAGWVQLWIPPTIIEYCKACIKAAKEYKD